jgi:hypothetical protein
VPSLTLGGMGRCKIYLHDLSQTLTAFMVLNIMNLCQILTIHLTANKHYGQKTVVIVEPGIGSRRVYTVIYENLEIIFKIIETVCNFLTMINKFIKKI